ncbi:MAG: hypothetical protein IKN43_09245 [Selenomonadaceae bacterium]|nr:hypothetical protein [Selenomonadaceae bacterium]
MEKLKTHDALRLEYMSLFARMADEREEGREEGREEAEGNMIIELLKAKQPLSLIMQVSKYSADRIAEIGKAHGIPVLN